MKQLIVSALRRFKWAVLAYIAVGIIAVFTESLSTVLFQKIIDRIPHIHALAALVFLIGAYVTVRGIKYLAGYIENWPYSKLESGLYLYGKQRALRKVAVMDYLAYQNLGTGRLVQRIENGAAAVRDIALNYWLRIVRELIPTALFSLIFIGLYNRVVLLILLAGYIVVFLISYALLRFLQQRKEQILAHEEDFSRYSVRGFMELVVFRVNKRFRDEIKRLDEISDRITANKIQILMIHELFFTLFAFLVLIVQAGVIVYQINQIIHGASSVGTLVALVTLVGSVYQPAAIFNVLFVEYRLDLVTLKRFNNLLQLPDDANAHKHGTLAVPEGEINVEEVTFSYGDRPIFRNLQLNLAGGRSTALVGATGSGKSTLVKLLLGLLKPSNGTITIDGQNIAGVSLDHYYDHIAYISQDAPVFDGTLRENLVFHHAVSDRQIWNILKQVRLDRLAKALPEQLDTEIGERGVKLSGGEKQRLAFARIFFMHPKIVILDEPTSALDSVTEEIVTNNMLKLFTDTTLIVVAHRLQTVKNVDRIVVFDDGEIIQDGTFDELLARPGKFRELWQKQTRESDATVAAVVEPLPA